MRTSTILSLTVICFSCLHDFENPSDSKAREYSERSEAKLQRVHSGSIFTGDTVFIKGGVSSESVEKASLVSVYHWDLDADGDIDTSLKNEETLKFVFTRPGSHDIRLYLEDKAGYVDSAKLTVKVQEKSKAPDCALKVSRSLNYPIQVTDTIVVFADLSCENANPNKFDLDFRWDTDGDGKTDHNTRKKMLRMSYAETGSYTLRVEALNGKVFLASSELNLEVLPKPGPPAYLCDAEPYLDTKMPIRVGDTVLIRAGLSCEQAAPDSLQLVYRWDTDGDRRTDTTVKANPALRTRYNTAGLRRLGLAVSDSGGTLDSAVLFITVLPIDSTDIDSAGRLKKDSAAADTVRPPHEGAHLPDFPNLPGFPNLPKSECAFFARDSSLMRTVLNFYNIRWEQTRSDGLQAIKFVEKLVLDIMGYSLITEINKDYGFSFNNGVYIFTADSFRIACAFHYGESIGKHAENDTIRHNLFSTDSYVAGLKPAWSPPFYKYKKGPLFELLKGDVSIDKKLNVEFEVNFSKIKFSFLRKTRYDFTAIPFPVLNKIIPLNTEYISFSRMAPVYIKRFVTLFRQDKLFIDHSGTSMTSSASPLEVIFKSDGEYKKANFLFRISQVTNSQKTAYGNKDGVLKISGKYITSAAIGFDDFMQSIHIKGVYSTAVDDSAYFYCDPEHSSPFGNLIFNKKMGKAGVFNSEVYGYWFPYSPPDWKLYRYRSYIE